MSLVIKFFSSSQGGVNLPVAVTPLPETAEPPAIRSTSNGLLLEQKLAAAKERAGRTDATAGREARETTTRDAVAAKPEVTRTVATAPAPKPESPRGATPQQRATSSITLKAVRRAAPSGGAGGPGAAESRPAERAAQTPAASPQPPATAAKRFGRPSRADATESAPKIDAHPDSQDVLEGESIVFECQGNGYALVFILRLLKYYAF